MVRRGTGMIVFLKQTAAFLSPLRDFTVDYVYRGRDVPCDGEDRT